MDIIKYLKKANIEVTKISKKEISFMYNNIEKTFKIKDIEQHLFFCLFDLITEK